MLNVKPTKNIETVQSRLIELMKESTSNIYQAHAYNYLGISYSFESYEMVCVWDNVEKCRKVFNYHRQSSSDFLKNFTVECKSSSEMTDFSKG